MPYYDGYNDAYDTPGWSAQNQAYPPPNSDVLNFPADVETVTISGHFRAGDGGRANGWFDIDNGITTLRHVLTKEMFTPIKKRVEIRDGTFSVTVPATDATTLGTEDGTQWYYHVRVSLSGKEFREYLQVSLPLASPVVDVYDLINADPVPGGPVIVIGGGTP